MKKIILASGSVARREMLRAAGLSLAIERAAIDEGAVKAALRAEKISAGETALRLARAKAGYVAARNPGALVIGADQILVCDENWFDKPADMKAARRQLLALRDATHVLETAAVCVLGDVCVWEHLSRPCLTMRAFSENFLDDYLACEGEAVLTSVGAYRLEAMGVQLFERIEGDHFSILGLPLLPLLAYLRAADRLAG